MKRIKSHKLNSKQNWLNLTKGCIFLKWFDYHLFQKIKTLGLKKNLTIMLKHSKVTI